MIEHKQKQYATQTMFYSVGVLLANFLQWVFSFVARHLTGNETFSIIGVFSSLSSLLGLFAGAISQSLERYLTYYLSAGKYGHAQMFKKTFAKVSVMVGGAAAVLAALAYKPVAQLLDIQPTQLVLLFTPSLFVFFLLAYLRGVLKAFLRFDLIALMMVVEGLVKTFVLAVAVFMHISLIWIAVLSITISLTTSFLFGYLCLAYLKYEKHLKEKAIDMTASSLPKREIWLYSLNALFDDVGLGLLLNVDLLLVNIYFNLHDTGIYATLSFFGKILFLSGSMFGPLILPITASVLGKGSNGVKAFLWLLAGVTVSGGGVVAAFLIFPEFFIHFFGGEKALAVRPYLLVYFFGMWSLLVSRSFSSYFQAKKDFVISRAMIGGALVLMIGIAIWHESLYQAVLSVAVTGGTLLVFSVLYFVRDVYATAKKQF